MRSWLDLNAFMGIAAIDWVYALAAAAGSYVALAYMLKFITDRLAALSIRTSTQYDDMLVEVLRRTHKIFLLAAAILIGAKFLPLPERWGNRLDHLWFLVVGLQLALWASRGVGIWTTRRLDATGTLAHNPVMTTMIAWVLRGVLWSVLLLAILANMGVNITAFVASLGVGGVAVALAVQSILSDLFASLAIGLDKPFEIGDFIVFGDVAGSIEHIGLKTTRIRSLSGEQVVCSNTELLKHTIHNYKRMAERRIQFSFGVTYDATPDTLRRVPGIVKTAVESAGNTRFDRAHFKGFGDSDLIFEVVYYVTDPSYNVYMDVQQEINLDLMDGLTRAGLEFAFPTRTVHVVGLERDENRATAL
ncbi:mechanosensitive ion channel family protein [Burkholderia multivorans]|uniref:Mechanosensitive ion channel family protein n=2 Tax=Burkholderia cepacia complex TaxID=87882 RepID=A0A2S9LLV0_9BURK|nr:MULTISPECIES: mechanosensitive ion channel family protein [Burkholderia cepacia complex]AIO71077.1 mechanosensitive ion channel family protein [Burkholderia multivorans]AYY99107.1 mechanosensitive ion channel family protein [Burkholderia multivorans]KVV34557.1 mechanosensitive ion channel protein MscS [Burkholderia multivorans]MBJ9616140.1 mechanosensitive ion channel family protein [Burkholderia multivorans]MBU9121474.1 mechanosensitive ion channel family protein [Burkholderia multivorans]